MNPAQFAPHEDFGSYPRQQEEDLKKLEEEGVDMVFLPTKEMMYPDGYDTYVESAVGSGRNEGAVRPHFFKGVATVCCKLFNIVQPDVVFFGQKDAQQVRIALRTRSSGKSGSWRAQWWSTRWQMMLTPV